jgi:hypothetical protein
MGVRTRYGTPRSVRAPAIGAATTPRCAGNSSRPLRWSRRTASSAASVPSVTPVTSAGAASATVTAATARFGLQAVPGSATSDAPPRKPLTRGRGAKAVGPAPESSFTIVRVAGRAGGPGRPPAGQPWWRMVWTSTSAGVRSCLCCLPHDRSDNLAGAGSTAPFQRERPEYGDSWLHVAEQGLMTPPCAGLPPPCPAFRGE